MGLKQQNSMKVKNQKKCSTEKHQLNTFVGKLVLLECVDIMTMETALVYPEDIEENVSNKLQICGFLVKETKDRYFLAREVWEEGLCKYIHIIPKCYVSRKVVLK